MNDEATLLAAILAHPDEDTPRLMYADWLDEFGQPERAEFIRIQCDPTADEAAEARAEELEERFGPKWLAGLPDTPNGHWGFRRGFPEYLDVRAGHFLDHYHSFARIPWLRFLSLYQLDNSLLRDFLNRPWPGQWVELDLEEESDLGERSGYTGTPGIVALANSPRLSQLRALQLSMFTLDRGADSALAALRKRFGERFSYF